VKAHSSKRGLIVSLAVVALLAAACSSRGGSAAPTTSVATTTSAGATTTTAAPGAASPCGHGDAKGATAKGVTETSISIATIADIKVAGIGNLFQGNLDATRAFVAYCNSLGGVNGRQLKLTFIDSKLLAFPQAMQAACDGGYLALIGSAAALDGGDGPAIGVKCGIPDIVGFAADAAHRDATNVVQPLPNPATAVQLGAQFMMKAKYPDAVKHAAYVYSNRAVTLLTAKQREDALTKNGWVFGPDHVTSDLPSVQDYQAIVSQMQSAGVTWVSFVGAPSALANLLKAEQIANWHPTISDTDQSAYDPEVLSDAGSAANGINFPSTLYPLEEAAKNPETQLVIDWEKKTNAVTTPTALGIQSFSAGLLFAEAVKELGSNVTRDGLFAKLHGIHQWTGEGLHAQTDPGKNIEAICVAWMTVKDGKFTRLEPAISSDKVFNCDPKYVVPVKASY
jgi:ABC-type branched-subunit amino acid transport system substrate-binding protein